MLNYSGLPFYKQGFKKDSSRIIIFSQIDKIFEFFIGIITIINGFEKGAFNEISIVWI